MNAVTMTYLTALASVVLTLALAWSHRSELRRLIGSSSLSQPAEGPMPRDASLTQEPPESAEKEAFPPTMSHGVGYTYVTTIAHDVEKVVDTMTQLRRDIGRISSNEPRTAKVRLKLEKRAEHILSEVRHIETESKRLANEDS